MRVTELSKGQSEMRPRHKSAVARRFFMSFAAVLEFFVALTSGAAALAQASDQLKAPVPALETSGSRPTDNDHEDFNATSTLGISLDPFDYDVRGRRDPFAPPVADKPSTPGSLHGPLLPLQRYDLVQLTLVGVLWDVRHPKAMLKDPTGTTHIVGPNTKVGPRNGYIASIREGEIVIVETIDQEGRLVSTAQVVKIAK